MGGFGKMPIDVHVSPETDDEDACAGLCDSVVRRVEQATHDAVVKSVPASPRVHFLKTSQLLFPAFEGSWPHLWMPKPQLDVRQIIPERRPRQTPNVLEKEGGGPQLPNGSE